MSKKQEQIINAKLKDAIKKVIEGESNCYYDLEVEHKEKAIKSHSVWNSGILKLLAHDNKVFWIDPKKRFKIFGEDEKIFHEVVTKNATIYRGFCEEHDNNVFEQIEKDNAYTGTLVQNFLYSYRAFSYQHVQNKLSKIAYENMFKEIYRMSLHKIDGFTSNKVIKVRESIDLQNKMSERGDTLLQRKNSMNALKIFR